MGLIKAKCTECGAPLQVVEGSKKAKCPHCGNVFIVEDAVNNYTYNTTNNIKTDVVNIVNPKEDFIIKSGVLVEYVGADDKIVIPEGIKKIGSREQNKGAFQDTAIESVTIPASVKEIGHNAFQGCKYIKNFEALSPILLEEDAFKYAKIENMTLNIAEGSNSGAFSCAQIENLTLIGDSINCKIEKTYDDRDRKEYYIKNINVDSQYIECLRVQSNYDAKTIVKLRPDIKEIKYLSVRACEIPNMTNYVNAVKGDCYIDMLLSNDELIEKFTIQERSDYSLCNGSHGKTVYSYGKKQKICPVCGTKYKLMGKITHKCKECKSKVKYKKD